MECQVDCAPTEPADGNLFVSAYPPFSCWNAECVADIDRLLNTPAGADDALPWGLYVHVPFCLQRCQFCYYRSFADPTAATVDDYLRALIHELALYQRRRRLAGRPLTYVYFGGGTPSLLSATQIRRLFLSLRSLFPWSEVQEVTFECSPRTATRERLEALRRAGVTRVSLGVQQMDDNVLRQNGRIHLTADVWRAYAEIRRCDFPLVNLDLMVGLVGETDQSFENSLREVIEMEPESITFYQLEIPPNTPLHRALRDKQVAPPPNWETKRRRLAEAFAQVERHGYTLRSAYAAVRDPARHQFLYQDLQYRGADLVGTGLAAFSYVGGSHFQNVTSLHEYQGQLAANRLPIYRGLQLSRQHQAVREFVLQLKLGGVAAEPFQRKYGVDIEREFHGPLERFSDSGWISVGHDGVRVTRQGLLHVDRMLPAFYAPPYQSVNYW